MGLACFQDLKKNMAKNLVIVESPAKAKTISRFLGSDYKVLASMGHIRDLPEKKMGIDTEHDFEPKYEVSAGKKKVVKQLKDAISGETRVWIATDEDREGEAIGWHLLSALGLEDGKHKVDRIVFHEITKKAIDEAISHPRDLDLNLVDAQQARRILDRLVGYELSPFLWRKVQKGLSAGRVQSVAVRLVVDREREIRAFKPEEFWKIKGEFSKKEADEFGRQKFFATLGLSPSEAKKKLKTIGTQNEVDGILTALKGAEYKIGDVEEKDVKRNPSAPFTTSTLQQEASRKLGFSVKKTMMLAQQLYEGADLGHGSHGLITYMRTDSVNLSDVALTQAREVITSEFGAEYALATPRYYKAKKGAQEAHEAIRPVDLNIKPADVEGKLEKDLARLYELVWKRTVACQMKEALLKQVNVSVLPFGVSGVEKYIFNAKGETISFAGFMKVYMEDLDEDDGSEGDAGEGQAWQGGDEGNGLLPVLVQDENVDNLGLTPTQNFTKPPARYTEASLVKKMESEGIGRPSTYAPTISTIMTRGYVKKDAKYLVPEEIGEIVTDVLVEHFANIVDYKFTAKMEDDLDEIAEGKQKWVPVIKAFYEPFHANLDDKTKNLKKSDIMGAEETNEICEKCGKGMVIKFGKFGKFLACSNFPECKNTKDLRDKIVVGEGEMQTVDGVAKLAFLKEKPVDEKLEELKKEHEGKKCEKCGADMAVRKGRFGYFLGCSAYPKCKTIVSIDGKSNNTGVKCPVCEKGELVEKRTRRGGKPFWGCNAYPKCKFATWDKPLRNEKNAEGKNGIIVEGKEGEKFVMGE